MCIIGRLCRASSCPTYPGGGGTAIPKRWECAARAPWRTLRERNQESYGHQERIIEQFISNIYKCKVSPSGTFSLGNFLFDERENYQV